MKFTLLTAFVCFACLLSNGQTIKHKPYPKSKQINDAAIATYLKNPKKTDTVKLVIAQLDKAIKLDSAYYGAWANKLNFECQLKKYKNAVVTAGFMAELFPWENDVRFSLGILQLKTKQKDKANATFNALIATYNTLSDTGNTANHLKSDMLNKGLTLILTDKTKEGREYLTKIAERETDPAVKKHIISYSKMTKKKIVAEKIPGKDI